MTLHQLTKARVAAPTPPQHDHTAHLLGRWTELVALTAAAAAHRPGEEWELWVALEQVEQVLRDRSPKLGQVIDGLLASFEVALCHTNELLPAEQCLICRRARTDAPRLALEAIAGGTL